MDPRITLITLGVSNLDRARAFYERLGWARSVKAAEGVAFFQCGGIGLALWPWSELAADARIPAARTGYSGVALAQNLRSRAEVDDVLAEAVFAGATLLKEPAETFYGGYGGYFADPDGHVWEIAFNPSFALNDDGSVVMPD
jgi:predicted lactoylglutathione lyase